MSGAEIVLGIAGVLTSSLAPALDSAIRRIRKKKRHHHSLKREKVISNFIGSWVALQTNVVKLVDVLPSITEHSADRRKVIKELERATKLFQETNAQLLSCVPIDNALREQEKAGYLLQKLEAKEYIAELPGVSSRKGPKVSTRDASYAREHQTPPESSNTRHRNEAGANSSSSTPQLLQQQIRSLEDQEFFDNASHPLSRTVTTTHTIYEGPPRSVPMQINTSHRSTGPYHNPGGSYSDSTPTLRSPTHHSPISLHSQMGPSHSRSSVHAWYGETPGQYGSGSPRDSANRHW